MFNFKFIIRASVFFILVFVLFFHNISLAEVERQEEEEKPMVSVLIKDVKIEKKEDSIGVSALLQNPSSGLEIPPSNYLLMLEEISPLIKPKSGILPQSLIVSAKEGKLDYSLSPLGKKTISLNLPLGFNIPRGNYNLILRILSDSGDEYGYYEDVVFDLGGNQKQNNSFSEAFLAFDQESCVIIAGGEKYKPNEGPIFSSGESPQVSCLVKNVGNKEVAVYPVVDWKEYFVYGGPSSGIKKNQKKLEQEIKFSPGEIKNVALSLPGADNPQVYQSLLSFAEASNEIRSFNMSFRWTVGGNSARVDKITLASPLKNVYDKGEMISLSVDYFGSMDLYWKGVKEGVKDLGNLKITATIKDKEGNVCGTGEFKLPDIKDGYSNNQKIDIALDKKCENISYNVSLVSGDKKLAEGSGVLPKVVDKNTNIYYFYGIGLFFIIVIFLLYRFRKNKNINSQIITFFAIFAFASSWFGLVSAYTPIDVNYPDDDGKVIRGETVNGGTLSSYSWGGGWTGGTLWLKASRGEGNERQALFSVKGYDGNEVNANFSDYFNSDGAVKITTKFKYAFSGCGNEIMYVRTRILLRTDSAEDYVNFRRYGTTDTFNKYEDFTVYANTYTVSGSRSYEIQKSELSKLYDSAKKLRGNPKVILEYTMVMDNTHAGQSASKLVDFGTINGATLSETWDLSDAINIEIPLSLKDPSVDLSGTSPVNYNCKSTLSWTVNDVDSCTANGGWGGNKSATDGTHPQEAPSGIIASTNYGLSCPAYLGSGVSTGTYTDSVTVSVNAKPNVQSIDVNSGLDFKKGSSFYIKGRIQNITELSQCIATGPNSYNKKLGNNTDSKLDWIAETTWSDGSKTYRDPNQITNADYIHAGTYTLTCANANSCNYTTSDADFVDCDDCVDNPISSSSSSSSSSSYGLTVKKYGIDENGNISQNANVGTIESDPTGINCGSSCSTSSHNFAQDTEVTLTAKENGNYVFSSWTDDSIDEIDCGSESGSKCLITMNETKTVRAYFKYTTGFTLTVTKEGNGAEDSVVTTSSNQIDASEVDCGTNCVGSSYDSGTIVILTAQPDESSGVSFVSWSGVTCTNGTNTDETNCTVTMNASKSVIATFKTDLSAVADCYADSSAAVGDEVTFTAEPNEGGESYSWSGGSGDDSLSGNTSSITKTYTTSGTKTATVEVTSNGVKASKSCDVEITSSCTGSCDDPTTNIFLTVNLGNGTVNSGNGIVTAIAVGEDDFVCEDNATCEREYSLNTEVTLTAEAYSPGGSFKEWTQGPCSGSTNLSCTFTMNEDKKVTATFTNTSYNLTVYITGTGSGSVYNNDLGESLYSGEDPITWSYMSNDEVILDATTYDGNLSGWDNSNCSYSSYTCTITMTKDETVTVNFDPTVVSGPSSSSSSSSSRPDVIIQEM